MDRNCLTETQEKIVNKIRGAATTHTATSPARFERGAPTVPRWRLQYINALLCYLGFRYSSSFLAISANRLAIRPPHQQNKGAPRFARRQALVFAGGRIAKRFALIAKNDDE